ncbi:serine/threonine-protein kinase polo [Nilaparvata lugens]|uniref:serine/threonine-protein kinase polo n=1 Tax=Nilaparvata lugens TaxID=108931 RepID=UPI000B989261|nr:serine/threonine-protein kinase polo [Nilaparvata lugens]
MTSIEPKEADPEIPDIIVDNTTGTTYMKGRFFGKGGFAKCYEITDTKTNKVFAGKIVSKKLLLKSNQKEKMMQEIEIHRSLHHDNIVQFYGFFDDQNFVYIVLELCRKRSMMELHRRRKTLTEPEVRYYMRQLMLGVLYLHEKNIIHRDLKLGNLFLNDDVQVKIGDLGLAARIEYRGQRKRTLCGTPNYIAPEILNKKGHSFEVDVWSMGCIMYTLLVGKPPFETKSLKDTYGKIKRCEYRIPTHLRRSQQAVHMIMAMLQGEPSKRPSVKELLNHPFFSCGYMPSSLPVSCLTMTPRFDVIENEDSLHRKPLTELNSGANRMTTPNKGNSGSPSVARMPPRNMHEERLHHMQKILCQLVKINPNVVLDSPAEDQSDPALQPLFWVSKWVDYSDKYGFGYQLCDDSVGVIFNDCSKIVLLQDQQNVHYFEQNGIESYYTKTNTPSHLEKKMKLLSYFLRYMTDHLMKTGESVQRDCDRLSRIPYVTFWHRSSKCVLMLLANGTLQVNFMDHNKLIICPLMQAVTHINEEKQFRTYSLETIEQKGCSRQLLGCIDYVRKKLRSLIIMENDKIGH